MDLFLYSKLSGESGLEYTKNTKIIEKGTDLFFYSKTRRGVRVRVREIDLSPFSSIGGK